MPRKPSPFPALRRRLEAVEERARPFQAEGLPIPTAQLLSELDVAVRAGDAAKAEAVVKRPEALVARADQDWGWLGELLRRVDSLRGIADAVGLDLARIDARVGNPRTQLLSEPLSPTSLEKAAAGASFALAVLNDAIPKYIVAEAQELGDSIRRARDRGEDVHEAVAAFTNLLRALQEPVLGATAERLTDTRRAVARIPRAPPVAAVSEEEEDAILREARGLARRLHRIKTRAHDATDAVRLITQVRSALSEDRRLSPEEEVEALWAEVDRLTREKRLATAGPPLEESAPAEEGSVEAPAETEGGNPEGSEPVEEEPLPVRIVPPPPPPTRVPPPVRISVPRVPSPIVPPVNPVLDERAGAVPPPSPDALAEGAGPRSRRPTRIAIAAAYVPPDASGWGPPPAEPDREPAEEEGVLPPPGSPTRRPRSRHREV